MSSKGWKTNEKNYLLLSEATLRIFGIKVSYFTMLYELTKMKVFFYFSAGVAKICLLGCQNSIIHFCRQIFHIFSG